MACGNVPPTVEAVWELPDADAGTDGTQIMPFLGGNRTVKVCAIVCDDNGPGDIAGVNFSVNYPNNTRKTWANLAKVPRAAGKIDPSHECSVSSFDPAALNKPERCDLYNGSEDMSFFEVPGMYNLSVAGKDLSGATDRKENKYEYLALMGLELDANLIDYGVINPGQTSMVSGDSDMNDKSKPTVRNIGNVLIDAAIQGTDMGGSAGVIPVGGIEDKFDPLAWTALTNTPSMRDINLAYGPGSFMGLSCRLTLPIGTPVGLYKGMITVNAVSG